MSQPLRLCLVLPAYLLLLSFLQSLRVSGVVVGDDADVPEEEENVENDPDDISDSLLFRGSEKRDCSKVNDDVEHHEEPAGDSGPGEALQRVQRNQADDSEYVELLADEAKLLRVDFLELFLRREVGQPEEYEVNEVDEKHTESHGHPHVNPFQVLGFISELQVRWHLFYSLSWLLKKKQILLFKSRLSLLCFIFFDLKKVIRIALIFFTLKQNASLHLNGHLH